MHNMHIVHTVQISAAFKYNNANARLEGIKNETNRHNKNYKRNAVFQ